MYQKLSRDELIEKIEEIESERNELLSLYLTASSLIREANNYIATLWGYNADLKEELIVLKESKKINFNVKAEFETIKAELRELDEKKKGEIINDKNL